MESKHSKKEKAAIMLFGVMIGACWTFLLTASWLDNDWKMRAVRHGHAEFFLDENHNRQWRWLPVKGEVEGEL